MKQNTRFFWLGLGLGLFVLLTTAGILTVDYQGRRLSFGDAIPLARVEKSPNRVELTVKAFGQERTWDVTRLERVWQFILEFGCIPQAKE